MLKNLSEKALLICTAAVLLILVCFSGCNSNSASAVAQNKSYEIDFTAEYNEETNSIDTVLTNNTGNLAIFLSEERKIYRQSGNEWENVTFSYAFFSTETAVLPKDGKNTYEYSYAAYPTTNDGGNDITKAKETKYLEAGNYKIVIPIGVCDPTEYPAADNSELADYVDSGKNRVDIEVEALFTVE